jgi:hypothetical protein
MTDTPKQTPTTEEKESAWGYVPVFLVVLTFGLIFALLVLSPVFGLQYFGGLSFEEAALWILALYFVADLILKGVTLFKGVAPEMRTPILKNAGLSALVLGLTLGGLYGFGLDIAPTYTLTALFILYCVGKYSALKKALKKEHPNAQPDETHSH